MELQREALIDVAMGYAPADTVIENGRLVNVHTGLAHCEEMPGTSAGHDGGRPMLLIEISDTQH